jgi:hypothetical protein
MPTSEFAIQNVCGSVAAYRTIFGDLLGAKGPAGNALWLQDFVAKIYPVQRCGDDSWNRKGDNSKAKSGVPHPSAVDDAPP